MDTVTSEWASYRESEVPTDADEVQVEEMYKAFLVGCWVVLGLLGESAENGPLVLKELTTLSEKMGVEVSFVEEGDHFSITHGGRS